MIEPGDTAPDFTLPDLGEEPFTLSDLRGAWVVLYFYPKAGTPGCIEQACGVRDHMRHYERADAVVVGVSPDSPDRLERFAHKQDLPFTLLSDADHAVAEAYGVWVEKSMYGRKYMGVERTTFVIDPDGDVLEVMRRVKPAEHDERVLDALAGTRG